MHYKVAPLMNWVGLTLRGIHLMIGIAVLDSPDESILEQGCLRRDMHKIYSTYIIEIREITKARGDIKLVA